MEGSKEQFLDGREEIQVVTEGMLIYLSSLLDNTVYDEQVRGEYYREISEGMEMDRYNKLRSEFYENQVPPVTHGTISKMEDIHNQLKKHV